MDDNDDEDEEDDEDDEEDRDDEDDEDAEMRMRIKMRMMIMMSRAVVGLQNLLGPASENPPMPGFVSNMKKEKHLPNENPNLKYACERCSRQCSI